MQLKSICVIEEFMTMTASIIRISLSRQSMGWVVFLLYI